MIDEHVSKAAQRLREEVIRLTQELEDLEALLAEKRERISQMAPVPVQWRAVPCGPGCRRCPHGPYPYLRVKKDGKWRWKYLGKGWQPPEGFTRAGVFRQELALYRALLKRKEALEKALEKALLSLERPRAVKGHRNGKRG